VMLNRPGSHVGPVMSAAAGASVVFFVYLLLLDGGIFSVYLDDRKLSRAEFFENCGLFLWRMLRLALYSLIPFGIVAGINGGLAGLAGKLSNDAPSDRLGFYVNIGGKLLCVLLFLFVRLWFDLSQARVVHDNERKVLRTVWRSLKLAFRSGGLYTTYIGIALFSAVVFGLGSGVWFYLPHNAMGASFLLLELVTIIMIASRLWMKAASARWVALLPVETVAFSAPVPVIATPEPPVETPSEPQPLPSEPSPSE